MRQLAGGEVHLPEKADASGIAEGRDEAVGLLVDETARHGAERVRRQVFHLGQRIFGERREVRFLEPVLECDPVVPHVVEALAVHMVELAGVERF